MMHKKKRILLNDQFDEFQNYVTNDLLKKSSWTGLHGQVLMVRSLWTCHHGNALMDTLLIRDVIVCLTCELYVKVRKHSSWLTQLRCGHDLDDIVYEAHTSRPAQ